MQYVAFTADKLIRSSAALVKGFSIGASAASVVNIYDGTSSSGTLVFNIEIPQNETAMFSIDGVPCNSGVYVDVVSGSVKGSVFVEQEIEWQHQRIIHYQLELAILRR